MYIVNAFKHFKKIMKHKYYVCKYCFKFGLYKQGIFHDMSKLSPVEFFTSAKYYQGISSPIVAEKAEKGYSKAWLHHFHKNPHHWAYWIDFNDKQEMVAYKIPFKYVIEAVADWIGAGIAYNNEKYNFKSGQEYYKNYIRINDETSSKIFHKHTRALWDIIMQDLVDLDSDGVAKLIKSGYYESLYNALDKTDNIDDVLKSFEINIYKLKAYYN